MPDFSFPLFGASEQHHFRGSVHDSGSLAEAIGSGREAAISIDRCIKGQDLRLGRSGRDKALRPITEPEREIPSLRTGPSASSGTPGARRQFQGDPKGIRRRNGQLGRASSVSCVAPVARKLAPPMSCSPTMRSSRQ